MSSTDNSRIAKNTLFLYVRMILTILVNIYTVRVIWDTLGVEDYGVYNVVGGVILMFAFLNNAMVASSQRFISFELGRGDETRLNKVFCISLTVHILIAICVLILGETIGLWFINHKLNIPPMRFTAANWVYQCSIIAFMINIVSVPYTACIVAHEHMKAYGYFGIVEVLLKLIIVFMLLFIPGDKLIIYAILLVSVSGIMRLIYGIYCKQHFKECTYHLISDKHLMGDMFSFAGWSFVGNLGFSVRDQGLNIVLNMFYNVTLNAAKGIASQIGGVLNGFAQSFQMAISPQITKRYAAGNVNDMMKLVISGCKYSGLLMMLVVIPFYFWCGDILRLWLKEIPPFTVGFMQLTLGVILIDSIIAPVTTAIQSVGRIKWFQIIISIIMLLNLPLAWILLKFIDNPYIVVYVTIFTSFTGVIARMILLHNELPYSYKEFITKIFGRIIPTLVVSYIITQYIHSFSVHSLSGIILIIVLSVLTTAIVSFLIGLNQNEKGLAFQYVKKYVSH